ncbi:MAG TPA: hypothetical protein VKG80_02285, partial [Trebonia sp.]|nr:hypothetical protein [Trebonia sp.]
SLGVRPAAARAVERVRLPGLLMCGPGYPEEFLACTRCILYVQKKVSGILVLKWLAGGQGPLPG